jgi:hypothetical protein
MGHPAELPERWTGRFEIDLVDEGGRRAGCIELVFRLDTLEMRFIGGRFIAAIPRNFFRYWLVRRNGAYEIDDVVWWFDEGELVLSVRGMADCATTPHIVHRLFSVL